MPEVTKTGFAPHSSSCSRVIVSKSPLECDKIKMADPRGSKANADVECSETPSRRSHKIVCFVSPNGMGEVEVSVPRFVARTRALDPLIQIPISTVPWVMCVNEPSPSKK